MVNVLLLTREQGRKGYLSRILGTQYVMIPSDGANKVETLARLVDIAIVDLESLRWDSAAVISRIHSCRPGLHLLGIGTDVPAEVIETARRAGMEGPIDLGRGGGPQELCKLIDRHMEHEMLIWHAEGRAPAHPASLEGQEGPRERSRFSSGYQFLEEMSQLLTHGYDLDQLANFVLSFLNRTFAITRLCVLLPELKEEVFSVRYSLGLPQEVSRYVRLSAAQGLARFLADHGTAAVRNSLPHLDFRTTYLVRRDLRQISCTLACPIFSHGDLVGILGLGPKVTGEQVSHDELKCIFLLCSQFGLAIQNLTFYKEMLYQKKYSENILRNASSGVVSVGMNQQISICNPRARRLLRLTPNEAVIGSDLRALPAPLADILYEALQGENEYDRKEVFVPAIKRWLGINTSQIRDVQGQILGGMMIFTDLTPVKHLKEAQKQAQKRELLGRVAARVSHELRNSFVPIRSMVELLPERYGDAEFRERLFTIAEKEIGRIDHLIERLVFFSQSLHLDRVACQVQELIGTAIARREQLLDSKKDIPPRVHCAEDSLLVYADREKVVEALTHIFVNAIEAAPTGEVQVEIDCRTVPSIPRVKPNAEERNPSMATGAEYVEIRIRDNGPGFPIDCIDTVFDPSFTTKDRGVGLGLTIAQTVVEEHGGLVLISNSKEKAGAVVRVYLPRYCPPS